MVGHYDTHAEALDVHVAGGYAYLTDMRAGLSVLKITELPYIRAVSRTGNGITIRWNGAPGVRLQSTSMLTNATWNDVPASVGQSAIELPLGNGSEFFRLLKP